LVRAYLTICHTAHTSINSSKGLRNHQFSSTSGNIAGCKRHTPTDGVLIIRTCRQCSCSHVPPRCRVKGPLTPQLASVCPYSQQTGRKYARSAILPEDVSFKTADMCTSVQYWVAHKPTHTWLTNSIALSPPPPGQGLHWGAWEEELVDDKDTDFMLNGIASGFDIIDHEATLTPTEMDNHPSASSTCPLYSEVV
jgi:hypothetical protein